MAMTAGSRARARRMRDVLTVLTRSDLQVRYGRGRLRFVKWVLDPIAALGIYLLLVAFVLDQGTLATGLSLACAIVPFQLLLIEHRERDLGRAAARLDHPQHALPASADPGLVRAHRVGRVRGHASCCCRR